jgi:pimeloyl-ACP methyl ester carboxylesterase
MHKIIGFLLNIASLFAPNWVTKKLISSFALPPKPAIRPKEMEFLDTAKKIKVNRSGVEIMEYHWGENHHPLVVLSYGWGYNAGRWRHFVPTLLENDFKVVAYDPAGHGLSQIRDLDLPMNASYIRAIVEEHGSVDTVLAHSFGGASSVYAVYGLPKFLQPKKMILMASFNHTPRVFRGFATLLGLWESTFQRMVSVFEARIGQPLSFFDLGMMSSNFSHIKGLIVHSPSDKVTPFRSALRYHSYWSGSYLYAPEQGGHHLGTNDITKAVLEFIVAEKVPNDAQKQVPVLDTEHELVQYFAEVG